VNLAIVIGRFPPGVTGGAEIQAEQWARRLADRHRITVITHREHSEDPRRLDRDGFTVVRLGRSRVPILRTALDLRAIDASLRGLSPRADLLLAFQTFLSGRAAVDFQRRSGTPAVVWVRGEDEFRIESWRTHRLSLPVWEAAAGVLVQSEALRTLVLTAVERFRPRAAAAIAAKTHVVPNGIELPETVAPGERAGGRGNGKTQVLAVGRLIADKAMDVVIDAAAGAESRLVIAGDGPERARLTALAAARGGDVHFEGAVPRARLNELYRSADVVVLASRRGEGLPNALLEAFAWGRPVVATPVGGVPDLVRAGENGLLVPPGDASALRAALLQLRGDPGLAAALAAGARKTAEEYRWERVRPRLEELLERWRAR